MSDIRNLEVEIAEAEKLVERRKMAIKLSTNREFQKLFTEEYFVAEAARLIHLSSDPALDAEQRADALAMGQATGHTKRYLSVVAQMGAHYERVLPEMRSELEELRSIEAAD